jgi:two-component system chemotaxis sensor kinase CheA
VSSSRDPELLKLLVQELERHLLVLESPGRTQEELRRTVHALKGSAGLAGEHELSAALQRAERRLREGDPEALGIATQLVKAAIPRIRAGEPAVEARWPVPPDDLAPSPLEPAVRLQYAAEVTDRLARIDAALAGDDPIEAATEIFRHVHTLKGAASAARDEPMAWFCHGLEERLRHAGEGRERATAALAEVAQYRAVLGSFLDDPASALLALRGARRSGVPSRAPAEEPGPRSVALEDATIRVATSSVDSLLDRVVEVGLVREQLSTRTEQAREASKQARRMRAELIESLRLIGPPRPWGAPAAALRKIERASQMLGAMGDRLEQAAFALRASDAALRESTAGAKRELSMMRQTPLRILFGRITQAVEAEAKRAGCEIMVRTRGGEETIDRRLAELLLEPCLQIARNSVAHGIGSPDERQAAGKPRRATVSLHARKSAGRLVLAISDDGRGVDIEAVRRKALEAGAVTEAVARGADDDTLLGLLFLPGFSTRAGADLLAGRGIGLDLALAAVQRLGGAIRLTSRRGQGFEARIDVPVEAGLVTVLWVEAAGAELALAAAHAQAVRQREPGASLPHLAACLDRRSTVEAPYAVVLNVGEHEGSPVRVGVDRVGWMEEVLVRPLSPLVAGLGPYAGAIVRGDGSLRLAIDAYALAPRARALEATRA